MENMNIIEHGNGLVEYVEYCFNGLIFLHHFELNGKKHGELREYNDNGKLYIQCHYLNDKLHGEYIHYLEKVYINISIMLMAKKMKNGINKLKTLNDTMLSIKI